MLNLSYILQFIINSLYYSPFPKQNHVSDTSQPALHPLFKPRDEMYAVCEQRSE